MVFHIMKTTFNIDDSVMAHLREESARQGKTITELVESALRLLLRQQKSRKILPDLPSFKGGRPRVNIAKREALYDLMEGS
jgi:hypothetical protein